MTKAEASTAKKTPKDKKKKAKKSPKDKKKKEKVKIAHEPATKIIRRNDKHLKWVEGRPRKHYGKSKDPATVKNMSKSELQTNWAHLGRFQATGAGWEIKGWKSAGDRIMTIVGTFETGCSMLLGVPTEVIRKKGCFGSQLEFRQFFYQRLVSHPYHAKKKYYDIHLDKFSQDILDKPETKEDIIRLTAELTKNAVTAKVRMTKEGKEWFERHERQLYNNWVPEAFRKDWSLLVEDKRSRFTENILSLKEPPKTNKEQCNKLCTYYCPTKRTQQTLIYLYKHPGWQDARNVADFWPDIIGTGAKNSSNSSIAWVVEKKTKMELKWMRVRPHVFVDQDSLPAAAHQKIDEFIKEWKKKNKQPAIDGKPPAVDRKQQDQFDANDSDDEQIFAPAATAATAATAAATAAATDPDPPSPDKEKETHGTIREGDESADIAGEQTS